MSGSAPRTVRRSWRSIRYRTTRSSRPKDFLRANLQTPRNELEYHRVTPSFFAISNVRDGVIYYSRCNFSRGPRPLMSCIDLKYPQEQKRAWDDVVTRISRSLRPLVRG